MSLQTRFLGIAAVALCSVAVSPAWAQSTWTYSTFTEATNVGAVGNTFTSTQSSTKLTVTAYSTGSGGTFAAANVGNYGTGSGFGVRSATEIAAATGGLVTNVTSPNHSMDNWNGTDLLALNFTNTAGTAQASVILTSLATGWHNTATNSFNCGSTTVACGTDSDISLLRWSGAAAPTAIAGKSIANLLSAGWVLVNNYADMVDDANRATGLTASSTASASSWWLISAYNSSWGSTGANAALSDGNDFVKVLASVSAVPVVRDSVPEPGSLALVAVALIGITSTRRRWMKQS
jgi:hypothetical protein